MSPDHNSAQVPAETHADTPAARKARRFFEHARSIADSDPDGCIESYIKGLRLVPEDLEQHKALRTASLQRMQDGGKPLGVFGRRKYAKGSDPVDQMINTEAVWAFDPNNSQLVLQFMELAYKADLEELVYWAGQYVIAINHLSGKPQRDQLVSAAELFKKIGALDRGYQAMKIVIKLNNVSPEMYRLKADFESQLKAITGWESEQDLEKVETEDDLMFLSAEGGTRSAIDEQERQLKIARLAYQKNPDDPESVINLADALAETRRHDYEDEALDLLQEGYERFGDRRFRERRGDLRIARLERERGKIRKKLEMADGEMDLDGLKQELRKLAIEQVKLEIKEWTRRIKYQPANAELRINLARRLAATGKPDEALAHLKVAAENARHRSEAEAQMARCHAALKDFPSSAQSMRNAVAAHPVTDDQRAVQLRYELMVALLDLGVHEKQIEAAEEARGVAEQILASHPDYRDIQKYPDRIDRLIQQLKANGA